MEYISKYMSLSKDIRGIVIKYLIMRERIYIKELLECTKDITDDLNHKYIVNDFELSSFKENGKYVWTIFPKLL